MRPIMSREVCARLRNISVSSVQMIRASKSEGKGIRRQISPFHDGESGMPLSLFRREHARMRAPNGVERRPRTGSGRGPCPELGAGYSSESSTATHVTEPGVTGDAQNMHACNHTKKFISYKSHFTMDAKYLIMANAVMPAGMQKCDGAKPVSAAINQRG
jgi:hypothetical protein